MEVLSGLRYLSVCSGIEAATLAWEPLGFKPVAFSEIDPFASAILAERYPHVPNAGDFTTIKGHEYGRFDILVGGTPCQAFSYSGRRGGLSDARGNLALEFIRLAYRSDTPWVVWENVPGVLSNSKGQAFRSFLHGLTGVDVSVPSKGWKSSGLIVGMDGHYSVAWRVLDAQYFGVPQRRQRVFVVGHLGDWRCAASVLFESESLLGHPPPSREAAARTSTDPGGSLGAEGVSGGDGVLALTCKDYGGDCGEVSPTLRSMNFDKSRANAGGQVAVVYSVRTANTSSNGWGIQEDVPHTLDASLGPAIGYPAPIGVSANQRGEVRAREVHGCLAASKSGKQYDGITQFIQTLGHYLIRRLTPRECERLQGFPGDFTNIRWRGKSAADGPRYKVIGNSMAIPCMAYIGRRIDQVHTLYNASRPATVDSKERPT